MNQPKINMDALNELLSKIESAPTTEKKLFYIAAIVIAGLMDSEVAIAAVNYFRWFRENYPDEC